MKAILVVSHGSHSFKTKDEVSDLVSKLRQRTSISIVEYAFLEIESPSIPKGIEECIRKGAQEVFVTLNFLNSGKHVDEDIPRIVAEAQKKHPSIKLKITPPVGQHPKISDLFLDIIS